MHKKARRIAAIIQARMGSTRLPGKVLTPIAGQPLLWHSVARLRQSRIIKAIAIATTTNSRDDAIVAFAQDHGVRVFRGPEDDVLGRFQSAASALDPDIIVRVSSDAPFVDARFVDHLLTAMIAQEGDYVLLEEGAVTAHEGVDPFSRHALEKLMREAREDPIAREHVTGYLKLHPDFVRIARAPAYPPLARKAGRLTIDTPEDLAFVRALYARTGAAPGALRLTEILDLLEREPGLRSINAHVKQKDLQPRGTVLIRCDGGGRYGYGHVKRCLGLARALTERHEKSVTFLVRGSGDALELVAQAGFASRSIRETDEEADLAAAIGSEKPSALILDCRESVSRRALERLRSGIQVVATIDDASERRLVADVAYYPPVPQAKALDWRGSRCDVRVGWEWALIGISPLADVDRRTGDTQPTLLVTMGGSDPLGLTLRCARAIAMSPSAARARFVIGPGMRDGERVAREIRALHPQFATVERPSDLSAEYARADMALTAYGVSALELAAFGVPSLYIALNDNDAVSASAFEEAGMGLCLGTASRIDDRAIATAIETLLANGPMRQAMHSAALGTIKIDAASRIADDLAKRIGAYAGGIAVRESREGARDSAFAR